MHFRNIRGHKLDFMEVFPDEGSINMFECIKVYHEVGYKYMLMPDHVPQIAGRDPQGTAFAFRIRLHHRVATGYRRAAEAALGHQRVLRAHTPSCAGMTSSLLKRSRTFTFIDRCA